MFAKHVDMEHACVTSMRLGTVKFTASVSSLFMCAANCFMPSMLNAKVLPALKDGVADSSSGSVSIDSSSSSSSSSSDSEEEQGGVPNPALGARPQITTDDEEYTPNPPLNVGPQSNPGTPEEGYAFNPGTPEEGEDVTMERPAEVQRCSLCFDFDDLVENHVRVCEELEAAEKTIAEL